MLLVGRLKVMRFYVIILLQKAEEFLSPKPFCVDFFGMLRYNRVEFSEEFVS